MSDLAERLRIGRIIARKGATLAADYFGQREALTNDSKLAPLDLVTEADRAVELLLKNELAENLPDDGFWGEETGGDLSRSLWVADPIDGTSNFVAGLPLWGTSLAYVENGEAKLGFLVFPQLGTAYEAIKDGGAFRDGTPIHASTNDRMDRARVIFGRSPALDPGNPLKFATGVLAGGAVIYAFNCCIFNLSRVAEGACHAYYEEHVHPWDYAAAGLLAREAGARVQMDMSPEAYARGGSLLASAPALWDNIRDHATMN
ncbi:MAG: inositol monophosphatase [Stappiaceae bacterium]